MKAATALFSILFLTAAASAQRSASVLGRVTWRSDQIQASRLTLTDLEGKTIKVETISSTSGTFRFDSVEPGKYRLTATAVCPGAVTECTSFSASRDIDVIGGEVTADLELVLQGGPRAEVSVVATGSAQPIDDVSKTVDVIEGQEMRDRADISLVDSLRTIPGFRVQQLGGFGRAASIKTRGLRNQDTSILIDGIRFRDVSAITGDATAFLGDMTLTSVSRVEVLRGSGSSVYGTNAIGGAVDFQTPVPQPGLHGQISGALGELGLRRFRGNIAKGLKDGKFGVNLGVSRTVYTKGIDGDDDAENTNVQSRVEFDPTKRTNISVRLFASSAKVRLNSDPDTSGAPPPSNASIIEAIPNVTFTPDTDDPDNTQRSKFFDGQAALTHIINEKLLFSGYYSGIKTSRRNDNGPLGVGFQSPSTSIFEGSVQTLNGHINWAADKNNDVKAGYEFEAEAFDNSGYTPAGSDNFATHAGQTSHTIFAQDLLHFFNDTLQLAGSARAQFFRLSTPRFSVTNSPFADLALASPPAAFTFDGAISYFFRGTGTKVRAHVGNGYRVPSLYERFGTFFSSFGTPGFIALGDPGLKPERTIAGDAGIEQNLFSGKARLTAVYFYTKLIDTIGFGNVVPDIGNTPRPFGGYENQKGGIARGLEFSGRLKPGRSTDIFASYTFTNSDQRVPQISGNPNLQTLGIPKNSFTLTATQRFKRFWVNMDFTAASSYLAPIFDTNGFTFQSYVYRFRGNRRADLTGGYTLPIYKENASLRIFGTFENLFDDHYYENGFRTPGRNGRLGLSIAF